VLGSHRGLYSKIDTIKGRVLDVDELLPLHPVLSFKFPQPLFF